MTFIDTGSNMRINKKTGNSRSCLLTSRSLLEFEWNKKDKIGEQALNNKNLKKACGTISWSLVGFTKEFGLYLTGKFNQ